MNSPLFHTVRWKFLYYCLASAVVTAAILYLGQQLAKFLIHIPILRVPVRFIIIEIGSVPAMVVIGCALFIVLFFVFSQRTVRRLTELNTALQEIGEGSLHVGALSKSTDEIGQAADSINRLADRLSGYLEQMTFGLQEIASGRFEYRIVVDMSYGELSQLGDHINRMAEQLERSIQDERNAEKTKNDLITGVSHDLRTPLTSILGFLEVIENDRYQDEVELRHYVNIAYEKSLTLKKRIDDLFEYTRINNGLPLEWMKLDLVGFLQQLAEEYVPILEQSDMTCRVTSSVESLIIMADGNLLVRGFDNLVTNAIHYGHAGKCVDITIAQSVNEAIVCVINYGDPIPNRDLPFIFDRFYRGDRSRSSGGTGLGLAIVKSIVEVHGGKIAARSDRIRTVFEIKLPFTQNQNQNEIQLSTT